MKRFFYLLVPVLLFSCSTKTKKEVKKKSHTSWCDCAITEFEMKHNPTQEDKDFMSNCYSYMDSLNKEDKQVWATEGDKSGCFDEYLWSFGDEDPENLGSFESALKIKPKPIKE